MPDLVIRIKKKSDGSAALSCTRADGSVTWQRQDGKLGLFFPLHDLTHYAVETTLGFSRAFYGLLADGWDISDFGKPEHKGVDLPEAGLTELIVGFFDLERATGHLIDATDVNEKIATYYLSKHQHRPDFQIDQNQVDRIRTLRSELFTRWNDLPAGETLALEFKRAPKFSVDTRPRDTKPRART
ncbi:MAG TPA: hypothetical protein VGP95_12405 [Gemmatimonadaceae bacterium]|jgi:hypothetical protein|nr:hypothetical protein [Gemmatimonadaceae bacterium]